MSASPSQVGSIKGVYHQVVARCKYSYRHGSDSQTLAHQEVRPPCVSGATFWRARNPRRAVSCHCEERSHEPISCASRQHEGDCFASLGGRLAMTQRLWRARNSRRAVSCHCEERSDEAISCASRQHEGDCFACLGGRLAMTRCPRVIARSEATKQSPALHDNTKGIAAPALGAGSQ